MADKSAILSPTFNYNPKELTDFSKIIHELLYGDFELERLHFVEEGIDFDEQIVFASNKGLMGKKVAGCTPHEIDGVTLSNKFWRPVKEDFRLTHCSASVDAQNKLVNMFSKLNPDFYEIFGGSQSKVGAYLIASVLERLKPELLRKVWFNDTEAKTTANGGVFKVGTDLGYFNTFDGFFKQFMEDADLMANNRVDITALQANDILPAGEGFKILRSLYKKADIRLRTATGVYFAVTQSIYDAYLDDLEDAQVKGAGNTAIVENGQVTLMHRNIPVIPVDLWDRVIAEYQVDPDGDKNLPHRAVITTPDNVRVGTLAKGDFGTVDAFYDRTLKTNFVDGIYSIDAKLLENYKIAMAF